MELKEAEIILNYDETGEMEIREEYSGRGMFGKTTAAITCDNQSEIYRARERAIKNNEELNEIDYSFDSMGLGIVCY